MAPAWTDCTAVDGPRLMAVECCQLPEVTASAVTITTNITTEKIMATKKSSKITINLHHEICNFLFNFRLTTLNFTLS